MWQDSMTAGQLGLDRGSLEKIIRSAMDHKAAMERLNAEVGALAPEINRQMNSDAGRIMHRRLLDWTSSYNVLTGDFQQLIDRATRMLRALMAANTGASQSASSG